MSSIIISKDGHLKIPHGTTTVQKNSWWTWGVKKKSVKTVTIPDSVTIIGASAFQDCSLLGSVTIPNTVTAIELCAFAGCCSLRSVTIPRAVTIIGGQAFQRCTSLTLVTFPESLTFIGQSAFCGCSSLTSLTIPSAVTFIGMYAFLRCTALNSVTVTNSATNIRDHAFEGCSSLNTLMVHPVAAGAVQADPRMWRQIKLASIARVWAPDAVIRLLGQIYGGPFRGYFALNELPRAMRALPDEVTFAAGSLWLWWSNPQDDADCGRQLSAARQSMVWTVMHVSERLFILPTEMWLQIFTFVKHDPPPM